MTVYEHKMRRRIAVAIAATFMLLLLQRIGPEPSLQQDHPTPIECHEDDPCWDCHTMGNLICGVKP